MISEQQKINIINTLIQIDNVDIPELLKDRTQLGVFSVAKFTSLTKRVILQLRDELSNGIGEFLPIQYNYQNEYANGNLESDTTNLLAYLQNVNYHLHATAILSRLIYYQIDNGFWDKSQRKLHNANDVKAKEVSDKMKAIEVVVDKKLTETDGEKEKLKSFLAQKSTELQQIERNVQTSNNNNTEISNLLNQSVQNNEKINSLVTQQNEKFEETKKNLDGYKKEYSEFKTELEKVLSDLETRISKFEDKNESFTKILEFVEGKRQYFEERNNYLDNLLGKEVGAKLFHTFKDRKTELNSSVNFWKIGVPLMSILLLGWVFILFGGWEGHEVIKNWEIIVINTLKTIPVIILLYFVISQYSKERNFQEEYAFKSAVALTIVEYSKQLHLDENKDKLILEAVSRIFNSPIPRKETKEKEPDNSTALEAIKGMKDTAIEGIKSIAK
jgi:hypothetical protein